MTTCKTYTRADFSPKGAPLNPARDVSQVEPAALVCSAADPNVERLRQKRLAALKLKLKGEKNA